MPPIDLILSAHIQIDPFLKGTYGLQGNKFSTTIGYLSAYIEQLDDRFAQITPKYSNFLQATSFLIAIEQSLEAMRADASLSLADLAQSISANIMALSHDAQILIPGGWLGTSGGHAMIYQIIRRANNYHFMVINSGAGLSYHFKASSNKELYKPIKSWEFPRPDTAAELAYFIGRILAPMLAATQNFNAAVLYEEILALSGF